ncbi:hypothetical protein COU89_00915 [Candidatus Roizmanbacteria bacterium CG10_big_fil_rev_8_21_14_0_10_45_7]|uniref:Glycosyltransferase RgtA/B/C/D-like domain-containing protein n=1 Tax=Candidatus Roizmanbacteria bacterium CG10_big_fil_rev_8_21_14_0_10_45_7 TaxID=1974854 RepID=A0A2M8KVB8_9BACT|nr:MAG: hypothetical protein COU89_00915 [Candidatus Roizmanbacteria bacterium CG10_big_fil_rev_8_21_14_0_10_45_7]
MINPLLLYYPITLLLFIYSYGFVDLNLTLSSNPILFNFVTWVQHLVYFNRPLSLKVFIVLIVLLYLLYSITLLFNYSLKRFPWRPVIFLAVILSLSYPMLSSDVFKYLFAAKELLVYHANPHLVAPWVFEGDTWLRFMRWIHTPSPYGPVMTALAIPYYILGFGKFVPTLYLFKLDQIFWYGLSIWVIGKLSKSTRAQLFFALNPLVLLEWLVNAHNDAPMISLLLLSLYLFSLGRRLPSLISLLFSIGIKYVTIIFLPFIFLKKKIPFNSILYTLYSILFLAPLLYHYSSQYQPWYVTWLVPFAALSGSTLLMSLTAAYSLGALLRYIPFIQTGLWHQSATYFALLTFLPLALTALYFLILYLFKHYHDSNYSSKR